MPWGSWEPGSRAPTRVCSPGCTGHHSAWSGGPEPLIPSGSVSATSPLYPWSVSFMADDPCRCTAAPRRTDHLGLSGNMAWHTAGMVRNLGSIREPDGRPSSQLLKQLLYSMPSNYVTQPGRLSGVFCWTSYGDLRSEVNTLFLTLSTALFRIAGRQYDPSPRCLPRLVPNCAGKYRLTRVPPAGV